MSKFFSSVLICIQGIEKPIVSKMLEKGSNRRAYAVDLHAGLVSLTGPLCTVCYGFP